MNGQAPHCALWGQVLHARRLPTRLRRLPFFDALLYQIELLLLPF